jgi:hypothetical protein
MESNHLFSREFLSGNMIREIVGEVPLLDSLDGDWIGFHDPSTLVHIYCKVYELYRSQSIYCQKWNTDDIKSAQGYMATSDADNIITSVPPWKKTCQLLP